jgi:MYXO-CTERM domain-containing protein
MSLKSCSKALPDVDEFGAGNDCDDDNAFVFPEAIEFYNDGLDQDCDGLDRTAVLSQGGCACSSSGSGSAPVGLALLLLAAVRRRC